MKAKYVTCPACQCVSVQLEDVETDQWSSFFGPDILPHLRGQGYLTENHGNRACPQCSRYRIDPAPITDEVLCMIRELQNP